LLNKLFQGADAAGQGDEGIGALEHYALARMHVRHDDEFIRLLKLAFA